MMSVETLVKSPKRRRTGPDARDRLAVGNAVADVVGRFQSLQREAAFLNVALARQSHPDLVPRIAALRLQVDEMFGLLDGAVTTLAPAQQQHGRVHDLRRALQSLQSSIPAEPAQALR